MYLHNRRRVTRALEGANLLVIPDVTSDCADLVALDQITHERVLVRVCDGSERRPRRNRSTIDRYRSDCALWLAEHPADDDVRVDVLYLAECSDGSTITRLVRGVVALSRYDRKARHV